jgi:hypothetical protein
MAKTDFVSGKKDFNPRTENFLPLFQGLAGCCGGKCRARKVLLTAYERSPENSPMPFFRASTPRRSLCFVFLLLLVLGGGWLIGTTNLPGP